MSVMHTLIFLNELLWYKPMNLKFDNDAFEFMIENVSAKDYNKMLCFGISKIH